MRSPDLSDLQAFRDRLHDLEDDIRPLSSLQKVKRFNPRRALVWTFLLLIFAGWALLNTPWAQASGCWAWEVPGQPFAWGTCARALLDNFFMATSASCVTGLAVLDVPTAYTPFGQAILLLCIQLGGLSLLTLGTLIVSLLLGRVSAGGERQMMMSYGADNEGGAHSLLRQTVRYVFTFELLGTGLLFLRYFYHHGYPLAKSLWFALFHAISAFCNAGLSLHEGNLAAMRGDLPYLAIITLLVIFGGLGFIVLSNVFRYHFWQRDLRRRGRISLHARIVLWTTLSLLVGGGALFTIFEWNASLADLPGAASHWELLRAGDWTGLRHALAGDLERLAVGFTQSAMFRTAGFNLVPMTEITPPANLLSVILMLIGGSPGSMAGGIKTTTLVVLLLTIRAYIRGNPDVQVHRRTLSGAVCREAMVIVFFYLAVVFTFYAILLCTEKPLIAARGDLGLFYEVTSAFGTVGTSLDATAFLTPFGRLLISLAMFLGRIGPISLALAMADRGTTHHVRYPEETLTVG